MILRFVCAAASTLIVACSSVSPASDNGDGSTGPMNGDGGMVVAQMIHGVGPGIRANAPWVSFYGSAQEMGDLAKVASTFRLINIDADPGTMNFTPAQIAQLKGGGKNTVISYLNIGACENTRTYWTTAPSGIVSCGANTAAQIGPYAGYPEEKWMNPANADFQKLILDHVAPQLVAAGADGFFLDNLELIEHGAGAADGPCDSACAQGGLDLVYALRMKYPNLVIVMQNAISQDTLTGMTHGLQYGGLLDGVSSEDTYAPADNPDVENDLLLWQAAVASVGGHPFSITTEDYIGSCSDNASAQAIYMKSRSRGFSPYVTISSMDQNSVCYWPF